MLESQIAYSNSSPDFLGPPLYSLQTVLFEKTNIPTKEEWAIVMAIMVST